MLSYKERFKYFLKERNLKYTPERKEIIEAIVKLQKHFDAEDIYKQLRKQKSNVSLATIYRTIPLLIDSGLIIETLHCRDKVLYERIYNKKHHDHLVCINCGKIIEFYNGEVEKLQDEICRKYQFVATEHRLGIKGYCKECQDKLNIKNNNSKEKNKRDIKHDS
ncbi:MAG: Transcriptional regulator [candidate division TA06 bacterium 32_111]|nr:MAG: Transcriptional regulator [candidate division TA06 bacterium 32_111]